MIFYGLDDNLPGGGPASGQEQCKCQTVVNTWGIDSKETADKIVDV